MIWVRKRESSVAQLKVDSCYPYFTPDGDQELAILPVGMVSPDAPFVGSDSEDASDIKRNLSAVEHG